MISVILPVYNRADKLKQTLDGLNSQTYRDFEVIIVNDGSKDNPEKVFTDFLTSSKTELNFYYLNQKNQGAPASRNRGASQAKGEYLFFCDDDAVLEPHAFEVLLNTLNANPTASYAYPSFIWGKKLFKGRPFDAAELRKVPYIHTMALIRKEDYPTVGWDITIKKFQDWDLWLTMLENNKVGVFVDSVLFTVATGGTMSSWLPGFAYKWFPFLPAVKKYNAAMAIIYAKHNLS